MNCSDINGALTVNQLLTCWSEAGPVFIRHRMACLGCPMAAFETLEGAATIYHLPLDVFLAELRQEVSEKEEEK